MYCWYIKGISLLSEQQKVYKIVILLKQKLEEVSALGGEGKNPQNFYFYYVSELKYELHSGERNEFCQLFEKNGFLWGLSAT